MSLIYQVESAPTKGTRAGRMYNILELDEHQVTVAIPGLIFGRFSITRERLLEKAAELGVKSMPHPKPLIAGPSPKPEWFSGFKKFRLVLALAFTGSTQLSFAQNTFLGDREDYDHQYKCIINTDEYAKWIMVGEKTWYLAPDSITSQVMSVANWQKHRQYIKSNGFNEIDPDYYWNPDAKIVVMLFPPKKKTPGKVVVSTEYGTDIR